LVRFARFIVVAAIGAAVTDTDFAAYIALPNYGAKALAVPELLRVTTSK
jgi:hypothetical protein